MAKDRVSTDQLCIDTIRTLAMDAVQRANSGHPGTPMALAPVSYLLFSRFLRHNPQNPSWFNRDRFVLSCGHASMLLYGLLHLSGYELTLDDIRNFRQWDSITAGHPEFGLTPGVETTTGPLGQGCMTAVGMALAEAHLAARFNRNGHEIVNHHTYVICSDGDLMEGASQEAISLAGHLALGKLIFIYDDNRITIEGGTDITYSDDVVARFQSCGWYVQDVGDKANDLGILSEAIESARKRAEQPSLIMLRSHIAFGSPGKQDTSEAHGAPLGIEEVKATKRAYGWDEDEEFLVPKVAVEWRAKARERGRKLEDEWNTRMDRYRASFPELAEELELALSGELPANWDTDLKPFNSDEGPIATRSASGKVINSLAPRVRSIVSGAADLAPSTKTLIGDSGYISKDDYGNRNIAWGVREHLMCAASSGMLLHGGIRPIASTFFIFTDYARPAIRLAALMKLPVIYVMTHDSIGVGEDGPTHQPVEQLASFRAMPGITVIRPADANETVYAWRAALENRDGPTMLVLSRQKLPVFDRDNHASAKGLLRGGYVIANEKGSHADIVLIATGSEVQLAIAARDELSTHDIDARVVSLPSWELFRAQSSEYRDQVIPPDVRARLAIEAGASLGWSEWIGDGGKTVTVDSFGASAPASDVFREYGFSVANVIEKAKSLISPE